MSAFYSISVDPVRSLVKIKMAGFFTLDDIEAFLAARTDAHAALRCPANAHLTLNDLRGMKIQSGDVVEAFGAMLAVPIHRSRRLAFVVDTTLALNQLMRASAGRDVQCFEDPAQAEAWLLDEVAMPAHRAAVA